MTRPKTYSPQQGYKYQLFCRELPHQRQWDHCDYARDRREKDDLLAEYRLAYGPGFTFKVCRFPAKYS